MWGSGLSWNGYRNSCSVACVPPISVVSVPRTRAYRNSVANILIWTIIGDFFKQDLTPQLDKSSQYEG